MIRKLLEKFRSRPKSPQSSELIQASRLEPRIMYSAVPGAELLVDAVASEPAEDPNAAVSLLDQIDELAAGNQDIGGQNNGAEETKTPEQQLEQLLLAFDEPQAITELVFIDMSVDGYQQLVDDIAAQSQDGIELVLIDSDEDGVEKITETLRRFTGLEAIHIVSHGSDGNVQLGNSSLSSTSLGGYAGDIASWQNAMQHQADMLFYGCDLAQTEVGREFLSDLSALCDCNFAASDDLTGSESLGGDWELEYEIGVVDSEVIFSVDTRSDWMGVLESVTVTTTDDVVNGDADLSSIAALKLNAGSDGVISLREAIIAANANADADIINLGAGTYTLSIAGEGDDLSLTGDLDLNTDITIQGINPELSIIDGDDIDRVVDISGDVTLRDLSIHSGNTAANGGGIQIVASGSLTGEGLEISMNQSFDGGAIYNAGHLDLSSSTLFGNNIGGQGGGIRSVGTMDLVNVTVSGNTASGSSGGISVNGGATTLTNVTIANNFGSGLEVSSSVSVQNTIIAGNSTNDVSGVAVNSLGGNVIGDGTGSGFGVNDSMGVDPGLDPLASNGGPVMTHAISASSVAHDFGVNAGSPSVDARGFAADSNVDAGAYQHIATSGAAIWSNDGDATPNSANWNESTFDVAIDGANLGQWRSSDAAEAPTRDEIIAIGVDNVAGQIQGQLWNGTTWTAFPFNTMAFSLDNYSQNFDVAYESQSGNAIVVWDNASGGTSSISYRIWDGTSWSSESTITAPNPGVATQLRLEASPTGNEMVLVVSDDNTDEWAMVWDGSSWGNPAVLDTANTSDRTEISVAFEAQTGHAMVVYDAVDNYNDLNYQTFNGTSWSGPQLISLPNTLAETDVEFTTLAADPNSDRIALGVVAGGTENHVLFAVWDGTTWGEMLSASTDGYSGNTMSAAVGFEAHSGRLMATYAESSDMPRYQTWTDGVGWSGELELPNIGGKPRVMTLSADPATDSLMLGVQDDKSDLNFVLWNGSSWGAVTQLTDDTGETASQTFRFVFDSNPVVVNNPPEITSNGGGDTASINVPENSTLVTTVTANDAESDPVTYGLSGGADQALFTIDPNSGVLSFLAPPNFENPSDNDTDGVYEVEVSALDGRGGTDVQTISITVTDANDAPTLIRPVNGSTEAITINADGGNDTYLLADSGFASPLDRFTFEIQFQSSFVATVMPFISYNNASGDELTINTTTDDMLELDLGNGSVVNSSAVDYNALFSDGNRHTLSVTWDKTAGDWEVYVDGSLLDSGSGLNTGNSIETGGVLLFGQEQDSPGGGFDADQYFSGEIFDIRIFDDVRTAVEIDANKDVSLSAITPDVLANWQFNDLSVGGVISELASGNNLTVQHISQAGFSSSLPSLPFLTIDENSANSTVVGQVEAVDEDTTDTHTYAITGGNTGGAFAIDNSGVITVANSSALNFETDPVFNLTIEATDSGTGNLTTSSVITINLLDVDDNSEFNGVLSGSVDEGNLGDVETTSGTISISDEDLGDNPTIADVGLTLGDNGFGSFELSGGNWTYTLDQNAVQYLDVGESVNDSITYTASDGNSQTITVTISGSEDGPTVDYALIDQFATQNSLFNYTFAANSFGDVDTSDTLTYTATLADDSALPTWLNFDAATRTFSGTPADDDVGTINVKVTADDGSSTVSDTFSLDVADVNDAPLGVQVVGSSEGGLAINADGGNDTFLLADSGISVPLSSFTVEVQFEATGPSNEIPFISYNVPSGDELTIQTRSDNSLELDFGSGTVFSTAVDYNALLSDGAQHTLSVTWDNAAGDWEVYVDGNLIDSGTGLNVGNTIQTGGALLFGLEQDNFGGGFESQEFFGGTFHDVRLFNDVRTAVEIDTYQDQTVAPVTPNLVANWQFDQLSNGVVTEAVSGNDLTVQHANQSGFTASEPQQLLAVSENTANSTVVGQVTAIDVDEADSHTYAITGGNTGGAFSIDNSGVITVANNAALDFETSPVFNLTIEATDDGVGNLSGSSVITINLIDVDEASVVTGTTFGSVSEGDLGDVATASGTISISDVDAGDNPFFADQASTLGNNGYGSFELTGGTWTYTLDQSAVQFLDVGESVSDNIIYIASDGTPLFVMVNITGTEDGPTVDNALLDQTATESSLFSYSFAANSFGDVDASDTLTFTATLADDSPLPTWLNFDSATRTFSGTPGNSDVGVIDVKVTADDGTSTVSNSFELTVDEMNHAPTASNGTVTATEDVTFVFSATDFNFSDANGDSMASVQVTALESVGSLQLNGVDVTLNQVISRADIDSGLLTFTPGADQNGSSYDGFDFTVNDGVLDSVSSYTMTVDVTPVNDAPTASSNTVVTNEDTVHIFTAGDFVFSDIDGDSLASVQITSLPSVGSLQLNGVDVTLNQVISRADIDAGLLTFDPVSNQYGNAYDSFDFSVNDGTVDSATSYSMSVDVTSVNDAPTSANNTVVTNEDTDHTFTVSDFVFNDIDGDSLASVQITSLETIGSLQLNGVDVVLNQVISRADIDAGLLVFVPVADQNGVAYDSFAFSVNDGTIDSSSSYTMTVDVLSINDAPTAANNTVITSEDTDHVFSASDFVFSDVDGDSLASIQITALESVGSLQLNGADVVLNQVISRADIDAGLLVFIPVADQNGDGYDSFDFTVNDGTVDSTSSYSMTVDVIPVNDAPTAANNTIVTSEDTDHTFSVSDFVFSDIDGDSLVSVQITALETAGSLQLNGVDVVLNQVVSRADIDAGLLAFVPIADQNGSPYDSFDFTVNDGTEDSTSSYSMTVDVTAVNDAPTAAANTVSTNEDTDHVFSASDFAFSDVDGDSLASIQITSLESVGSLQLNGADVTLNQVISRADIDAGLLTYSPVGNENGNGYDSFDFLVNDGTVDSASSFTMTIDVVAVNDGPVVSTNNALSVPEEATRTITTANLEATDPDHAPASVVYTLTQGPSEGRVRLNGSNLSVGETFTQDDINNGRVSFRFGDDAENTSFKLTVSDGIETSSEFTFGINGSSINDTPVVTAPSSPLNAIEQTGLSIEGAGFVFDDPDTNGNGTFTATLTVGEGTINLVEGNSGISIVSGNGSASVIFSGSESHINTFLNGVSTGTITYLNTSDTPSSATTITLTVNDNGNVGSDPGLTADAFSEEGTASQTINITPVNDAPTAASNTVVTNEDTEFTFAASDFMFADVEGDSLASVQVTSLETVGALQLNGFDVVLNQVINRADIDAGRLRFVPITDQNGNSYDSFDFTVNDGSSDSVSSYSMTVDVTPVNDTPTAVNSTVVTNEDTTHVFQVTDFGFSDVDGDSLASVQVTSLESVGVLQLNGVDVVLNQVISRADIDAGLLTFSPITDENGTSYDSFDFTVNDGLLDSVSSYTLSIDVTPLNDAPTASNNNVLTVEDNTHTFAVGDFAFNDIDGDSLSSIQITSLESAGALQLNGIDVVLNQVISRADIDAGLLTFEPALDENGIGYDNFDFTVNDGVVDSAASYTMTIDVTAVNDRPTAANNTIVTNEDTTHVFQATDFAFSDIDGDALASVQITSLESAGALQLNGVDVALNQVVSRADIDAGLLTFTPVSDQNGTSYDSFDFTVNDGTVNSLSSYTLTVDVTAVNDAPTAASNTVVTNEDTSHIFGVADFVFSDIDGDSLASVQITSLEAFGSLQLNGVDVVLNQVISRADIDAGLLAFVPAGDENGTNYDNFEFTVNDGTVDSVSSYTMTVDVASVNDAPTAASNTVVTNEDTDHTFSVSEFFFSDVDGDSLTSIQVTSLESVGALQLNGVDVILNQVISRADIDAGLLTFSPLADQNGIAYDSFDFTVNDGTVDSVSSYTMTIDVAAVNDAPTAASNTVVTNEDVDHTFSVGDFVFSDIDGDSLASVEITSLESVGSLQLNGVDVVLNQVISRADIDAGLLTFAPLADQNGNAYDSFDFTVNDGMVDSASSYTLTVDIAAVNDAPTAASNSVVTSEDNSYSFTVSDFGFGDVEGDSLASVQVTSLESAGQLQLNGVDVLLNQVISRADIDAGLLEFTPATSENGVAYDSFDFSVNDGTEDSAASYTMTIDVTAVDDPPTAANNTIVTNEDTTHVFQVTDFGFSDVDGDSLASVQITALEAVGVLQLNGVDVVLNQVISRADIDAGLLTFSPIANENGTSYDSFEFTVNDGALDSVVSYTMSFDVTAVNDAPTAANNSVATVEDSNYVFAVGDFAFNDIDGDSLASIQITSLESAGALQLNGVDVALNQVISRADIDAGLLIFEPAPDGNGNGYDSFDFTVNDGAVDSAASYTISIDVSAVNDAPTAVSNTVVTNEDTNYTFSISDFGFGDVDGDSLVSVQITSLESVGSLLLNGSDVVLNQVISRADIDAGLLTFDPVANENGTSYDSFAFTVNDGTTDSVSSYTMTVDVTPVNDAPSAANSTVVTNEDTSHIFSTGDFGYSDIEGNALFSIQITSLETTGSLLLNGSDVVLNQVISRADIDAGLLSFEPVGDANGTGYDSFGFTVNDGAASSVSSYSMTIDVTPVNDAPTSSDNTVVMNEDSTYVFGTGDFGYSDIEGDLPANIQVTSLETVGSLQLAGADVTLNQIINWADIGAGLLTFDPLAHDNGSSYDSFMFRVHDGTQASDNSYSITIDVVAVNDDPVNTLPGSVSVTEETSTLLSGVFVSDVDGIGALSTRLQVGAGTLNLTTVGSASIVAGANGTGDITIQGTEADINASLASLTYTGNNNVFGNGADSLTVTTNDLGNFGSGVALIDVDNVAIDIIGTQDLPTTSNASVTINEDEVYALRVSDFPFADVDGETLQQVRITNLPTNGALELNGVAVATGDVISATDIASGRLTFTPAADDFGLAIDGFGFRVGDGIGFSEATSTLSLLDAQFNSNSEGFVYQDDVFGTSRPGNSSGTYSGGGGFDGGGLMVRVGGRGGEATSGGWSQTINVAEDGIATVSLRFNLLVASQLDAGEYGEAILEIDGVRYGTGLNNSLAHYEGGGNSGWQVATFEVELSAGSHTLTIGAYANSTNANRERVTAYFDDVSVDHQVFNRLEFDVNPVNDASQLSSVESSALNYVENSGPIAITDTIQLSDVDDSMIESAVISVAGNYVPGEDVLSFLNTANISGSWDGLSGTLTLTGTDTLANYQAALRLVNYENLNDNPSLLDRTITFEVNDGDADSPAESRVIQIQPVNDASVLSGIESASVGYTENDGPVSISSTISISDVDDSQIESAQIRIAGNYSPGEDVLSFADTPRISGFWNSATGVLTLTGAESIANYEAALRSVTYENLSDNPSTATRSIRFTINDGDDDSNSQSRNIQVTRVNDAPQADASDSGTITYIENSSVDVFPTTSLSDLDDVNLESATIRITGNYVSGQDVLSFVNTPNITGSFDASSGILTLSGTDSIASYEAAIQSVQYFNTSEDPSTLSRTVELQVNDGDASSTTRTRSIDIVAVNDAPIANIDGPMIQDESSSFIVQPLANDFDPEGDAIHLTAVNGISMIPGGAAVSITGGSVALQADGLTLTFTPERNFFGDADFSYTVADIHGLSSVGVVQLDIIDTTPPEDLISIQLQEDVNNDGFINIAEQQSSLEYTVALPINALPGEILNVNGDTRVLTAGDVAAGHVVGSLPAQAHNTTVMLSAELLDPAGNASAIVTDFAVVDLVAPLTSAPLNLVASSDTGVSSLDNYTGDLNPNFSLPAGTGSPGDVVTIYSDGTVVGSGFVDGDGSAFVSVTVTDFTVQKFTYTFTDAAGNEGGQSIGLFVEFFDDALPYQPPSDPTILGVEQIPVDDPDPVISLFDLQASEDADEEREKIPFLRDLARSNSFELGLDFQSRSISSDEVEPVNFVVTSAVYYEKELDNQRLIEFSGDLNYRVATTGLDDLGSHAYQMENFLNRLTELANENREDYSDVSLLAGTASAGAGMVIAGYALWMVRAAFIASWFATSIPAFTGFDPLALLNGSGRDKETLAQIAKGKTDE